MTTREAIYKTALEHIRDGSDRVCFKCGWVGKVRHPRRYCPQCGGALVKGAEYIAAEAMAQGALGES